jgi:hypothetical protein
MDIDFKSFETWSGYTFEEWEFIKKTGFVEIRSFSFETRDDIYGVVIGKIGNDVYYYKDNYGKIWYDDFGKVE